MTPTFDPTGPLPTGRTSLDASAGTGKTWTIAALVVRYVAEGHATLDQLLVVTFTRAATAELRDRVRRRLVETSRHLRAVLDGRDPDDTDDPVLAHVAGHGQDLDHVELDARRQRVEAALADLDAALIATIHGFAHQVLRSVGFAADVDGDATLVEDLDDLRTAVARDVLVRLYADEHDPEVLEAAPPEHHVQQVLLETSRHPHARHSPELDDLDATPAAHELARVADVATSELARTTARRGVMTFDDLLHRLAATLRDETTREAVLATFRSRFRVALVDEAQDTDPVQWEILESLFADRTLVLIGDPKQAIYRFRGADVDAYVQAVDRPGTTSYRLDTNHRSDAPHVAAVNQVFRATTFGDDRIGHADVRAANDVGRLRPTTDPALELRVLGDDLLAGPSRRRIARDLVAHATRLLASGTTVADVHTGRHRPLRPNDLAVLVRSHHTVEPLAAALRDAGLPFVQTATGSVFDAEAAGHWAVLLDALGSPSSTTRLRALTRTDFLGWPTARVAGMTEDDLDELASRTHHWAGVLRRDGVASLLRTIQGDTGMTASLLGLAGGERRLTDLEHLGELLHAAADPGDGPGAMRDWLHDQRHRPGDEVPPEQRARRLDSDSDAVRVMTVHASKGLEFPIVYLPYLMWTTKAPSVPFTTTGEDPVLELGGPDVDANKALHKARDEGEALRLAYVAFTRARHRTIAWWWKSTGFTGAPISKLLIRDADSEASASVKSGQAGTLDRRVGALVERSDGAISLVTVPDDPTPVPLADDATTGEGLAAATFERPLDRAWTRTSYSGLVTPRPGIDLAPDDGPVLREDDDTATSGTAAPASGGANLPLGAMRGGARVGTYLHAVYEHLDFAAEDPTAAVLDRLTDDPPDRTHPLLGIPSSEAASGLVDTLRTPLGPEFGDLRLADVTRADRCDELAFELPVADRDSTLATADLVDVLRGLPADDPFADYADHLDQPALDRRVRGFLSGFVDLVLRRHTPDGPVFHVVDYKSNVLYRRDDEPGTHHYDHASLVRAMVRSHYPLQAVLYAVAVHRWLRGRQPDYDPARHLGAVGYLFVRGMVGPATPTDADGHVAGVMAWRPPTALVVELSDRIHRPGRRR